MVVAVRWTKYVKFTLWIAEEAKIYCNNFNSSNAVVCSHLILAYTVRLAIINAAELERNGCFSVPLLRNVVLWLKRTSTESLQIEFVTKYDTTMLKRKVVGVQICEGGSISAYGFGPGGLSPLWHRHWNGFLWKVWYANVHSLTNSLRCRKC